MARAWRASLPEVDTDNAGLATPSDAAGEDLGALRIFDPEHPDVPILAAGAPWFMTVFGRDSLLTAWMTLIADPSLARACSRRSPASRATTSTTETEEEPGKILHEMRFGAVGRPRARSGEVYYGSIDATPLFVMLLGELRRWGLADDVVDRLLPARRPGARVDRALRRPRRRRLRRVPRAAPSTAWPTRAGRTPGTRSASPTARWREPPIALCEVQGYVYAAYLARAHFAAGGRRPRRRTSATATKARDLRRRFNEDFWLDEHGRYALGLDADKRPIDALASNVGPLPLDRASSTPTGPRSVAEQLRRPTRCSAAGACARWPRRWRPTTR